MVFRFSPAPVALALAAVALALLTGTASAGDPLHSALFTRAYSPDFVATADDALPGEKPRPVKIYFRVSDVGAVNITSRRIVVSDPFVGLDQDPLALEIPNGSWPVRLAVLQGSLGRGRVAFARVDFLETPVVRWEQARPVEVHRDAENPSANWGFTIDSGIAGFFDPDTAAAVLEAANSNDTYFDAWLETGQNRGAKERDTTGGFRLNVPAGSGTVVAFDAGWGDGVYMVYAGYDADGRLTALVADFDIVDWSKVTE